MNKQPMIKCRSFKCPSFLRIGAAAALACALTATVQAAPVYSNGNVVDDNGLSVLNAPPNITIGVGASIGNDVRVADNFFVPGGQTWSIGSISFFAYQTGATAFSFTSANWQIVSGDLNSPTVVAGGSSAVTDEGLVGYRVLDTALDSTQRPIYQIGVDIPDLDLTEGSYWLVWSLAGSLNSGPFVPPTAFGGDSSAEQSVNQGAFARYVDGDSKSNVELPFQLNAPAAAVPEPTSLALVLAAGFAAAAAARRRAA